jgi:hypothetical protein
MHSEVSYQHRGFKMAEIDAIPKGLKTTGYWTEGIVVGSVITVPVLLLLFGTLGLVLSAVRTVLFRGGEGGVS